MILVAPIIIAVARALKVDFVGPMILTAIVSNSAGMLSMYGTATVYRDELFQLVAQRLESPASDIVQDNASASLAFKDSAPLADYVTMSIQINHDWKIASNVFPHLHWWQTSTAIPNWLMLHRWQVQGSAQTTAWSTTDWSSHAFAYSAGTLNQITLLGTITPPGNSGISDILQVRILRDTANASGKWGASDPLVASAFAVSFDVHKEIYTLGSNQEYVK